MERREERKVSHSLLSHTGLSRLHNTVAVAAAHTLTHCARCFSRESARAKELRVSDFFLRASTLALYHCEFFRDCRRAHVCTRNIYMMPQETLSSALSLFDAHQQREEREREGIHGRESRRARFDSGRPRAKQPHAPADHPRVARPSGALSPVRGQRDKYFIEFSRDSILLH